MSESVLSRPASEPDDVLTWGPEPGQVADLRLGSPDQPLVIVIHGGFWRPRTDRTHLRPMAHALAEAGYTVLSPEYRRVSGDPDVTMDDVRVGLQVLPTAVHGYFDQRVILMGHSAGGHLALWAGAICPPTGLIATIASSPVGDLQAADRANLGRGAVRDFLGVAAAERPDLDPARLPRPNTRTIVLAGSLDDEVPPAISQAYVQAHEGIESHVLAGAGHYEFIDPLSDVWTMILTTLAAVAQG
jgi:acetyl esterase/lipase